jgi:hypothetical protein
MSTIVTRAGKGSALTHNEVDANFNNLNNDKVEKSGTDPVVISVNSGSDALRITQTGSGNALLVEDSTNPDATPFVIDASGNVGIGTSSPAQRLHVVGSGNTVTSLVEQTTDGLRALGSYTANTAAGAATSLQLGTYADGGNTQQVIASGQLNLRSGTGQPILLNTDGNTERLRITSAGNVGIGTTAPVVGLHLQAATQTITSGLYPYNFLVRDTRAYNATSPNPGGGIGFSFQYNAAGAYAEGSTIQGFKENTTDGDYAGGLRFFTRPNLSNPAERMRIDSSGNVGIGASSTSQKLTVFSGTNNSNIARFTGGQIAKGLVISTFLSNGNDGGVRFTSSDSFAFFVGANERMRIDSSGNVGIGTSSPTARLQLGNNVGSAGAANQLRLYEQSGAIFGFGISAGALDYRADAHVFYTSAASPTERMRIDSSGNLGLGVVPSASTVRALQVPSDTVVGSQGTGLNITTNAYFDGSWKYHATGAATWYQQSSGAHAWWTAPSGTAGNAITFTQAMTLDTSGNLLVGNTTFNSNLVGVICGTTGRLYATANSATPINIDRLTNDGVLVDFRQANTSEGNISVSGTTVSYNGGHLARWSQLLDNSKDESILKGTVLSNLDEMCVWEKDGVVAENEQLNKMKVSDVEGDTNVAGVFVNWTKDEDYNSDDMNIAMTGDMIIRIAQGVTVQRGDLLMSAGDGTAKPQGDDIIRSKTIAKVTSIHVTCTYEDGSYCVPCVLMAC